MVSGLSHETTEHASSRGMSRWWRWFRSGITRFDLIVGGCVLAIVAGAVLTKLLTGWPQFRIFGSMEDMLGVLGFLGPTLVLALRFAVETFSGDDNPDDDGIGGASGQW